MSNIDLIIPERSSDIGNFMVGRLLPFREKRMVGPFIFIDHMRETRLGPDHYMDIDQHPHIGLSTLTFLLKGAVNHEDSIGTNQRIEPGSVNWMVAGRGVTHTERTPQDLRGGYEFDIHGFQIWVALPKELEDINPEFHHFDAAQLPAWTDGAASFRLVAGKGYGHESPLPVHSPLFMVDITTTEEYTLDTAGSLEGEIGICVVEGEIEACGQRIEAGNMLVSKVDNECALILKPGTHIILFGGMPLPEDRYIFWNFVSSDHDKIERAKAAWEAKTFPMMAHDDSYVPLPPKRPLPRQSS